MEVKIPEKERLGVVLVLIPILGTLVTSLLRLAVTPLIQAEQPTIALILTALIALVAGIALTIALANSKAIPTGCGDLAGWIFHTGFSLAITVIISGLIILHLKGSHPANFWEWLPCLGGALSVLMIHITSGLLTYTETALDGQENEECAEEEF